MRISDWSSDVCSSDLHALQVVGEIGTMLALPQHEAVFRNMGMAQMRDAGHAKAEHVTVAHHAADRPASEIDAMIALLAADDPQALALAAAAMVLDRHLDRALDGFRPRADEKDAEIGRAHV